MSVHPQPRLRRPLARLSALLVALVAVGTALPAVSARAQAPEAIVGTWALTFPVEEQVSRQLIAFLPGGVVMATNAPTFSEESAPGGRVHSTEGLGAWEALGEGRYAFRVVFLYFDAEENDWGALTVDGHVTVDAAGDHFAGSFGVSLTDAAGSPLIAEVDEPVLGTRVRPHANP